MSLLITCYTTKQGANKMACDFSQSFQQALLTLAGAIAQQQSVSVGSNISGTNSRQSVVVASTAVPGSSIGISAVNTTLVSSPATTSTTRTSTSNRFVHRTKIHNNIITTIKTHFTFVYTGVITVLYMYYPLTLRGNKVVALAKSPRRRKLSRHRIGMCGVSLQIQNV